MLLATSTALHVIIQITGLGAVWQAARTGDAAALEAALAAGGSTEEAYGVKGGAETSTPSHLCIASVACRRSDTALRCASRQGHVEAVRILLAAGAEVTAHADVHLVSNTVFHYEVG